VYKHIIWDWNGTLFDDAWLCVEIINGMLTRRGLAPLTLERYQAIFDFPVIDYYRQAGFNFEAEPFEQVSTEFITTYEARREACGVRASLVEVLHRNAAQGVGQSILSAARHDFLQQAVANFALTPLFSSINGVDDHHAFGKVELGRRWAAESGLDLSEAVFIGDTIHDYEVAQAIGVDCCLIPGGHQNLERLKASGAKVLESEQAIQGFFV